jgi:hypothetical protein
MPQVEALYVTRFAAVPGGYGAGVVVLETDRLYGGDSMYYWIGTYRVEGNRITARATVRRHTAVANLGTIFGDAPETFEVELTGEFSGEDISCIMARSDMPGTGAAVILEYRERLP